MASRVCWWCQTKTHMTVVQNSGRIMEKVQAGYNDVVYLKQAAFTCDQCKRMSIGQFADRSRPHNSNEIEDALDEASELYWLPERGTSTEFPDVPSHIGSAATEATLCLSVGAYRAVGAMARAVVEATCKDNGITAGKLWEKIDALEAADLIRPHTKEQAHEIRHFGNGMAHGDFTDEVTKEDAEEIVGLMAEILDEVYQSPAKLAALKAARLAKKAASQMPPTP